MMGHLGVIIPNGAKSGGGHREVQAGASSERPRAADCHCILGFGLIFC